MNARVLICIAMGVFTAQLGLFMLFKGCNRATPRVSVPARNFSATSDVIVNPNTGERVTERNITVSTELADPNLLQRAARE